MFSAKVTRHTAKPKLSLNISSTTRALTLMTNIPPPSGHQHLLSSTPTSHHTASPTAHNTLLNQRLCTSTYYSHPVAYPVYNEYAYEQNPSTKSILRRNSRRPSTSSSSASSSRASSTERSTRKVGFTDEPVVYCVTPINYYEDDGEGERYVYAYGRRGRDERRWGTAIRAKNGDSE